MTESEIEDDPMPNKKKEAYQSPVFRRYGDIRHLTQTVGAKADRLDGGGDNPPKTS